MVPYGAISVAKEPSLLQRTIPTWCNHTNFSSVLLGDTVYTHHTTVLHPPVLQSTHSAVVHTVLTKVHCSHSKKDSYLLLGQRMLLLTSSIVNFSLYSSCFRHGVQPLLRQGNSISPPKMLNPCYFSCEICSSQSLVVKHLVFVSCYLDTRIMAREIF